MNISDRRTPLTVGLMTVIATVLLAGLSACTNVQAGGSQEETTSEGSSMDWEAVGQAIGKEGEQMDGGVYRVNMPRSDLSVTSQDVDIKPGLALGSYAAFKETGENEALVMGDLVLTEDEYDEVISQLQEDGIEQTAIHKHLLEESPAIWWTHIEGRGDPVEMAEAINVALQLTGTPLSESGSGSEEVDFDTEQLDEIIGHTGKTEGGIHKYSIGRGESATQDGTELPPGMGLATVLNLQPTEDGQAAINGDFVMTEDEVNPVIRALRENGIEVVALHNHHIGEQPRLFYMHFWANDDAEKLAEGLRAALDETNSA